MTTKSLTDYIIYIDNSTLFITGDTDVCSEVQKKKTRNKKIDPIEYLQIIIVSEHLLQGI